SRSALRAGDGLRLRVAGLDRARRALHVAGVGLHRLAGAPALAEGGLDGLRVHLDRALEARAVIEADARRRDVPAYLRALADANSRGAVQVAFHVALDVNRVRIHVRADLALGPDREAVVPQHHGAIDLALDDEVFLAAQIAVDVDRRADHRGFA